MNYSHIRLVQSQFDKVKPMGAEFADLFYNRLFELAPTLRSLFPETLSEQKEKFISMLVVVVAGLNEPDMLVPIIRSMGSRHARYQVRPEHYTIVGEALLWSLAQGLGEEFTAEGEEAWRAVYGMMASLMLEVA